MFNLIIRFNNFFYSFLCRTKKIFIFVSDYGRYLLSNGTIRHNMYTPQRNMTD